MARDVSSPHQALTREMRWPASVVADVVKATEAAAGKHGLNSDGAWAVGRPGDSTGLAGWLAAALAHAAAPSLRVLSAVRSSHTHPSVFSPPPSSLILPQASAPTATFRETFLSATSASSRPGRLSPSHPPRPPTPPATAIRTLTLSAPPPVLVPPVRGGPPWAGGTSLRKTRGGSEPRRTFTRRCTRPSSIGRVRTSASGRGGPRSSRARLWA